MRLIDKDSLLSNLKIKNKDELKFDGSIESIFRSYFNKMIELFVERESEIDAVPVKYGKWIINPDGYYPYCSECKQEPEGRVMSKFCPNCGCKMIKED